MYFINFRVFLFATFYNKVLKINIYDIEHKSIKRELSKKKEDMKLRGRYRYGKNGGKELGVNNAWKYPSVNKNTKQGRKVFQNKERDRDQLHSFPFAKGYNTVTEMQKILNAFTEYINNCKKYTGETLWYMSLRIL